MLIQSWVNIIRIFPACPSTWKDAHFYHLRAEGSFLVSAVKENRKTQFIEIQSLAGKPYVLKTDFEGEVKLIAFKNTEMKMHHGLIELNLKKGEKAMLYMKSAQLFTLLFFSLVFASCSRKTTSIWLDDLKIPTFQKELLG